MEVTLYAVQLDREWAWDISLDMKVDAAVWFGNGHAASIFYLEPLLPLGVACDLRDRLRRERFDAALSPRELWSLAQGCCAAAGVRSAEAPGADAGAAAEAADAAAPVGWAAGGEAPPGAVGAAGAGRAAAGARAGAVAPRGRGRPRGGPPLRGKVAAAERWRAAEGAAGGAGCAGARGSAAVADALRLDARLPELLRQLLQGRALLPEELQALLQAAGQPAAAERWTSCVQWTYLLGHVELHAGISRTAVHSRLPWLKGRTREICLRCGSGPERMAHTQCASCGEICAYCEECLTMGRVRHCSLLICGQEPLTERKRTDAVHATTKQMDHSHGNSNHASALSTGSSDTPHVPSPRWQLSTAQQEAAAEGIRFLAEPASTDQAQQGFFAKLMAGLTVSPNAAATRPAAAPPCFLIWAVTGAGKTEMIFPLIEFELARGGRVLIATPRRDVVLELAPRIKKAFPENTHVTLYGGSEQRWEFGEITLATTHQLLRFRRAFDLIIIDEIDAFPYHNNPMLEYAARKAAKSGGKYIFLSATPPIPLQKAAKSKQLPHTRVPVRYHRHPLPVPKLLTIPSVYRILQKKRLPAPLIRALRLSLERGAQIFVFSPKIQYTNEIVPYLRKAFPDITIEGTSSEDPSRPDKVLQFRSGEIRMLVTTTILERGVTVPKTDVFILDAGSSLFDGASLVQMAGRAGRAGSDPRGRVFLAAPERTSSQVRAIKQIVTMNRIARKKGYLLPPT